MNEPVTVVILAAGLGSRLASLTDGKPKWLLDVGGSSIAERQLAGLSELSDSLTRTVVVTGASARHVESFLRKDPSAVPVDVLHNPRFHSANNWYSLLLALRAINYDNAGLVVVMNGDLAAEPAFYSDFMQRALDAPHDGMLAVDVDRVLTDESMKVAFRHGQEARVAKIGKVGVPSAAGEYVGMLAMRAPRVSSLMARLASFESDPSATNNWYEHGIQADIDTGNEWVGVEVVSGRWVEIDAPEDWQQALDLELVS